MKPMVKADGDTSGRTGHLHLFVDREPTAAGQAIPVEAGIIHSAETRIEVTNLAPRRAHPLGGRRRRHPLAVEPRGDGQADGYRGVISPRRLHSRTP